MMWFNLLTRRNNQLNMKKKIKPLLYNNNKGILAGKTGTRRLWAKVLLGTYGPLSLVEPEPVLVLHQKCLSSTDVDNKHLDHICNHLDPKIENT